MLALTYHISSKCHVAFLSPSDWSDLAYADVEILLIGLGPRLTNSGTTSR